VLVVKHHRQLGRAEQHASTMETAMGIAASAQRQVQQSKQASPDCENGTTQTSDVATMSAFDAVHNRGEPRSSPLASKAVSAEYDAGGGSSPNSTSNDHHLGLQHRGSSNKPISPTDVPALEHDTRQVRQIADASQQQELQVEQGSSFEASGLTAARADHPTSTQQHLPAQSAQTSPEADSVHGTIQLQQQPQSTQHQVMQQLMLQQQQAPLMHGRPGQQQQQQQQSEPGAAGQTTPTAAGGADPYIQDQVGCSCALLC